MTVQSSADRARGLTCIVDFGDTPNTSARVTVGGVPWVTNASILVPKVRGRVDFDQADCEDPVVEDLNAMVHNIEEGESFDVTVQAPTRTRGTYLVHIIGV